MNDISSAFTTLHQIRNKSIQSTFYQRVLLLYEADCQFKTLPQPRCLGEGIYYLLERIDLPIFAGDLLLGRIPEKVLDESEETFFQERLKQWNGSSCPEWLMEGSHLCPDWEGLIRKGVKQMEETATYYYEVKKKNVVDCEHEINFLRGVIRVYQGIRRYLTRWAEEGYKAGLMESAENCAWLVNHRPETFSQGIQLTLTVGLVLILTSRLSAHTFGRFDQFLLPLYDSDIASGRITRGKAKLLVRDFLLKIYSLVGIGEHQMGPLFGYPGTGFERNPIYDTSTYIIIGGYRKNGQPVTNDITELVLDTIEPKMKTPTVILRYTPDIPLKVWGKVCRLMRQNASIFIYNDDVMIKALKYWGVATEDAVEYSLYGCNFPHITGKEGSGLQDFLNLPAIMRDILFEKRTSFNNIHEVISAISERFSLYLEEKVSPAIEKMVRELPPGFLRVEDCFLEGTIETAKDWLAGGAKYHHYVVKIAGLATVVDSLSAIHKLVFQDKVVSLQDLLRAVASNFNTCEIRRAQLRTAPKFGDDESLPEQIQNMLLLGLCNVFEELNKESSRRLYKIIPGIGSDTRHIVMGSELGATPDGRLSGEPISENLSPSRGQGKKGLTAILNSVSHLPFLRIPAGVLNLRVSPDLLKTDRGLNVFGIALRTYFDCGGLQIQVSAVSREILLDAQIHPERYRDLTVRITGYSAYFVDIAKEAQNEIISRVEVC